MSFKFRTNNIKKIFLGSTEIKSAFIGTTNVFSSGPDLTVPLCFTAQQSGSTVELIKKEGE